MNGSVDAPVEVQVGTKVTIVAYADAQARAIVATATSVSPLVLSTDDGAACMFEWTEQALLICGSGESLQRADGTVVRCDFQDGTFEMEFVPVNWELLNRRIHPRVPVEIQATLRTVRDGNESFEFTDLPGVTQDLSMGGAWLKLDQPIAPGTLVEFQASVGPNEHVRVLSIVAFWDEERSGAGIQFLDYVGSACYTLHTYLSRAA